MAKDYISVDYDRVEAETYEGEVDQGAVLLVFGDLPPVWIPKSLIDPEYLPLDEDGGEVSIEFWKVKQEELEDFAS